jgi:hypothetical protein
LLCEAYSENLNFAEIVVERSRNMRRKIRTARIYLWVSPAEKIAWNAKAASVGLDLNEYIRRCVERRAIAPMPPEVNRATAIELGKIGVNLNQQVRAINTAIASGQHIPNVDETLLITREVLGTVKKLQAELLYSASHQN